MARFGRSAPYRDRIRWRSFLIVIGILAVTALRLWNEQNPPQDEQSEVVHPSPAATAEQTQALVKRVVDGDTLLLDDGTRVRLIGVDTPETKIPNQAPEPYGLEASRFTTRMVEGKTVRLEFDRERFDQYERVLAYVYIDGQFLNEELIRSGLSPAELQYPYRSSMKTRFRNAEKQAQAARLGIWSRQGSDDHR